MWAVVKKAINSTLGKHTKTIDEICELESYKNFYENLVMTKSTGGNSTAKNYQLDDNKIRIPSGFYEGKKLSYAFVVNPSVRIIESKAFRSAGGLIAIYIPPHCEIQSEAFRESTVVNFNFPNGTKIIEKSVLASCVSLVQIDIPYSVKRISSDAFGNTPALKRINYYGTMSDWRLIEKESGWDTGTGNYTVNCIDGNISKET